MGEQYQRFAQGLADKRARRREDKIKQSKLALGGCPECHSSIDQRWEDGVHIEECTNPDCGWHLLTR